MEIIKWENKNWSEIPEQDNPAFGYKYGDRANEREQRCLLVMKVLPYEAKAVGHDGYVVIEVPLKGDVIRRGLLWNFEDAERLAEAIAV